MDETEVHAARFLSLLRDTGTPPTSGEVVSSASFMRVSVGRDVIMGKQRGMPSDGCLRRHKSPSKILDGVSKFFYRRIERESIETSGRRRDIIKIVHTALVRDFVA